MDSNEPVPEWTDDLSVGVECLDEDHQAFFRLSALLTEILSSPEENQDPLIDTAINILEEYVEAHFMREESAMKAANYPLLAEHMAEHDAFANRVRGIVQSYRTDGDKALIAKLARLVARWIESHIRGVDTRYCGILTNDNVDARPLAFLAADMDTEADF